MWTLSSEGLRASHRLHVTGSAPSATLPCGSVPQDPLVTSVQTSTAEREKMMGVVMIFSVQFSSKSNFTQGRTQMFRVVVGFAVKCCLLLGSRPSNEAFLQGFAEIALLALEQDIHFGHRLAQKKPNCLGTRGLHEKIGWYFKGGMCWWATCTGAERQAAVPVITDRYDASQTPLLTPHLAPVQRRIPRGGNGERFCCCCGCF